MDRRVKVFVSSIVYDIQNDLYAVAEMLKKDYDVMMSMQGSLPIDSTKDNAFGTCLRAVEECDVFLGFIRPKQGSGLERGKKSITYQEFEKVIELDKPCFFMTDYRVAFADDYCEKFAETYGLDKDECLFDLNIVKRESVELYRLAKQYDKCKAYGGNLVFKNLNEILSLMGDKFGNPQRIKKIIEQWTR